MSEKGLVGGAAIAMHRGLYGEQLVGLDMRQQSKLGRGQRIGGEGDDARAPDAAGHLQHPILGPAGHCPAMGHVHHVHLIEIVVVGGEQLRGQGRIPGPAPLHQIRGRLGAIQLRVFGQQLLLDLHHLLRPTAGLGPRLLLCDLLLGEIVVLQIVVGDHAQVFDEFGRPFRLFLAPHLLDVALQNLTPVIHAIHAEAAMPGEMIQAQGVELRPSRIDLPTDDLLQLLDDHHLGGDGHIAHAHRGDVGRMAEEGLGVQARGIGEIHQQRLGGQLAHVRGDIEDDGDGAQGLGHAAHTRGLLAHQAPALAKIFIAAAGRHAAHPQLGQHIAGSRNARAAVGGEMHGEGRAVGRHDAPGETAHHIQPLLADIHQPQLVQRKNVDAIEKTFDEFGGVTRTTADNGYF